MKSSIITTWLAYILLIAVVSLFFPISKVIIGATLLVVYFLFLVYTALSKPSAAFYFLVFMTIPVAAFVIPSPISTDIPPLLQLAAVVGMWGFILSLIISIGVLAANYSRRRLSQPSASPPDHAEESHS